MILALRITITFQLSDPGISPPIRCTSSTSEPVAPRYARNPNAPSNRTSHHTCSPPNSLTMPRLKPLSSCYSASHVFFCLPSQIRLLEWRTCGVRSCMRSCRPCLVMQAAEPLCEMVRLVAWRCFCPFVQRSYTDNAVHVFSSHSMCFAHLGARSLLLQMSLWAYCEHL